MMNGSAVYAKPLAFSLLSSVRAVQVMFSSFLVILGVFDLHIFINYKSNVSGKLICLDCMPELCCCESSEKSLR